MTNYILYAVLFAGVIASGSVVLFTRINSKTLKLILSFSGAYLFAITILHLIPEIYESASAKIGVYVLAGFLLQIFIEFFSEGIEHGHIHIHKQAESAFPLTMMLALSVHSFLEGMPLAGEWSETKQSLLIGIVLHNIPIAIALMSMLMQSHISNVKAFSWLIVFALMTPLGTITNTFIGESISIEGFSEKIMGMVIGIFLHISTTILFESGDEHRFNLVKFATIVAGMGLAILFI
ncbi:MAG: zinc/iron permease [Bacteroidetes bacterium]|nr:MAG: zinc/iron permease [Bacteroidota bacterium]